MSLRLISIAILFLSITGIAQIPNNNTVELRGSVYDPESPLPLPPLMIVNKRTQRGQFANGQDFRINILKSDTIMLSVLGYMIKEVCMQDSVSQGSYSIKVALEKLVYTLKTVTVRPERSLNEIQNDIDRLGLNVEPYSITGIGAAFSPITYLYERFSKFSKSKRKVEKWENEDLKREVLQELFQLYIKYDIIDLDDKEFEEFIRYLNFSDEFVRTSSQLELVLAIRGKYDSFKYRWK